MLSSVHHVGYGLIEYEENFWNGKKALYVNGVELTRQKKNEFILTDICTSYKR